MRVLFLDYADQGGKSLWLAKLAKSSHEATANDSSGSILQRDQKQVADRTA